MLMGEELEVGLDQIQVEPAPPDLKLSSSTRPFGVILPLFPAVRSAEGAVIFWQRAVVFTMLAQPRPTRGVVGDPAHQRAAK